MYAMYTNASNNILSYTHIGSYSLRPKMIVLLPRFFLSQNDCLVYLPA